MHTATHYQTFGGTFEPVRPRKRRYMDSVYSTCKRGIYTLSIAQVGVQLQDAWCKAPSAVGTWFLLTVGPRGAEQQAIFATHMYFDVLVNVFGWVRRNVGDVGRREVGVP